VIETVTSTNLSEVLPLFKEYQVFYGVKNIDNHKNKLFFSKFAKSNDNGILHIYRLNKEVIGFTTIYKGFSSTRAEDVAILNDLYIQPKHRKNGYAKELINNALKTAKEMGLSRLQWLTSEDNVKAQHLYNNLGVTKSSWLFYAKET